MNLFGSLDMFFLQFTGSNISYIQRILHECSFHMKFMKRAFGEFYKFHIKLSRVKDSFSSYVSLKWGIICPFKMGFYRIQTEHFFSIRKHIVEMDVVTEVTCTPPKCY